MNKRNTPVIGKLFSLLSDDARKLLDSGGEKLIKSIGMDVVRGVVLDVLSGRNLRDSTEVLTRRRIASLNLATLHMFVNGEAASKGFVKQLPDMAVQILQEKSVSKSERWLAEWALGLTDKAVQNVLRDNPDDLVRYKNQYVSACGEVIKSCQSAYGRLTGEIRFNAELSAELNWLFVTYMLNTIGAQTLAIRGSEKSAYGKLFEKLILGSLLSLLGFKYVGPQDERSGEQIFWLSDQRERRESDATLLYKKGKGVRFDIGFIGRGNPEISLDKVTRFERSLKIGRKVWYTATVIIVDRIGANSSIEKLAKEVDGTIVQMSMGYWPQQVAKVLKESLDFRHPLATMRQSQVREYLEQQMRHVPLEKFLGLKDKKVS